MKKYELTEEIKYIGSTTLHRIRALRDFGEVKAGEFGGWIETENNLSHEGNAWVSGNALVYGDAEVFDDAEVCDNALVCGDAEVCDDARVRDNARVCGVNDWIAINNIGSRDSTTTFFMDKDKGISVSCGCFTGKIEKFEEAVKETHGDNRYAKEYMAAIELAKARILYETKRTERMIENE